MSGADCPSGPDGVLLSFEAFVTAIVADLELGEVSVAARSGLFDELGLDSFDAFRLLLLIEDLAGVIFPEAIPPELWTAGDAYAWYRTLATPGGDREGTG